MPPFKKIHVLTCKIHALHPNCSRTLNSSQHQLQVQGLIQTSAKSGVGERGVVIHPESKFASSCEPGKPENKLSNSKKSVGTHRAEALIFQKGVIG